MKKHRAAGKRREDVSNIMMDMEALLTELVQIPAPSGKEAKRAEYICTALKKCGYSPVIDAAGNVLIDWSVNQGGYTVLMAHMDTVFEDEVISVVKSGNILSAPGIGDDTSNVVFLMKVLEELVESLQKPQKNLLFAFNVCEEGMGNLKGIRQIMHDYHGRVDEVVSFDLMSDSICMKAVGSKRYRVKVTTPGGHSFHAFGQKGAVEAAAEMIHRIYQISVAEYTDTKTTYNVGMINGGTSVNTIAQECTFLAEIRSDSAEAMADMEQKLTTVFSMFEGNTDGIEVACELTGFRPTGSGVPEQKQRTLIEKASGIITKHTGKRPALKSGSTDCNLPLSMGIPSISFGGYKGGGTHTRQEWVDVSFMDTGYAIIREFVQCYFAVES